MSVSIVEDTIRILATLGITASRVTTTPNCIAIQAIFPNETTAYFIWLKLGMTDLHFRMARFWVDDDIENTFVSTNLPEAIAQTRVLINL